MKESYFFTHDYNARQDPKMQDVLMDLGVAGIGVYWCLIEQLYEQGGQLPLTSIKAIAFALHADLADVKALVENYGLFENDGVVFWSPSVSRRMEARKELQEKRRAAGRAGGQATANSKCQANATNDDSNCRANADANNSKCQAIKGKDNILNKTILDNNNLSVNNNNIQEQPQAHITCAEKEKILEIFSFDRNFKQPIEEVERFIQHYEASGWCRKDSRIPVKDKIALAKMWRPSVEGEKYPEAFRQWIYQTYCNAKKAEVDAAAKLITDITTVQMQDNKAIIFCTNHAAQAIEAYYAYRPDWGISYAIKNKTN